MPFIQEHVSHEWGELIPNPSWGGDGAYSNGARILQHWNRPGSIGAFVVADILLAIN